MTNREITEIIQGVIPPVKQKTADGVAKSGRYLHAVREVLHKEIVTGATHRAAGVIKDPPVVNWKGTGGIITVDRKTVVIPTITTTQVRTGTGPSVPPISIGSQKIEGLRRSIIPQEFSNSEPLKTSINITPAKHRDPTLSLSKVISSKTFTNESADVYSRGQMNFGSDTVLSKSPNFMDFGLYSVNTTDELGSPTSKIGRMTDGSKWIPPGHDISETIADRVIGTKAKNHHNFKSEFETRRDKMVDQYFGRQNDPMSQPNLNSTPLGTNKNNKTTSPIDSIPVITKMPEPTPLTRRTELSEQNGKAHVPGDPDPEKSLSELSSKKSNSSNDSKSNKSKKKKRDKKKKRQEYKKYDSSDPSSRDDSDSSYDSDYRCKRRKRKRN